MTLIKKLKCDICGKEKDLLMPMFGGFDTWQEFQRQTENYAERQTRHACSDECVLKMFKGE